VGHPALITFKPFVFKGRKEISDEFFMKRGFGARRRSRVKCRMANCINMLHSPYVQSTHFQKKTIAVW
jgi:hypothetical protein